MEISGAIVNFAIIYLCLIVTLAIIGCAVFCIFIKKQLEYIIDVNAHSKNITAMTQNTSKQEYFDSRVVDDEREWEIEQIKKQKQELERMIDKPKVDEIRKLMKARYNGR